MKRALFGICGLVVGLAAIIYLVAADYEQSPRPQNVFMVISADAPTWMRAGGSGKFICDGTADDVQIQAAIDAAQAVGTNGVYAPTVELTGGNYSITSPIYVGYNSTHTTPRTDYGCDLVGCMGTTITWGGTDYSTSYQNAAKYMIYWGIKSQTGVNRPQLRNLKLACGAKINGIWTSGAQGRFSDVTITYPSKFGVVARGADSSIYDNIHIESASGMGFLFAHFNGSSARRLTFYNNVNASKMPVLYRFTCTGTPTFVAPEELRDTATAAIRGCVVSVLGTQIIVDVTSSTDASDWVAGTAFTGQTSGGTGTLANPNGAVAIKGGMVVYNTYGCRIENSLFEAVQLSSATYDYPLIYMYDSDSCTINGVYCEGSGSDYFHKMLTKTSFIELDACYHSAVRDVWARPDTGTIFDASVAVTGDGDGTSTVSGVATAFVSALVAGDKVRLWDGAGGITDGDYTVESGASGTTFGVSDLDETDADCYCFGGDAADDESITVRQTPLTCVTLDSAHDCVVENVTFRGFRTSGVAVDAQCTDCIVSNVEDFGLESGVTEATYLTYDHPSTKVVSNSGTRTRIAYKNSKDYSSTGTNIYRGRRDLDGYEVTETKGVIDVAAVADGGKVYISATDTGSVASITGGIMGKKITLIAFSASVTLTDGADLDTGNGDYVIPQYGAVDLTATDDNSWVAVGAAFADAP